MSLFDGTRRDVLRVRYTPFGLTEVWQASYRTS